MILQLLLKKGSMHEALFRESDDPIKRKIFADRIEPYLDLPFYKVVRFFFDRSVVNLI